MKRMVTSWPLLGLFLLIFLGSISDAQSQDVFRELDSVKRELSDLRNELSNVKDTVNALQKAVLKTIPSPAQAAAEAAAKQQEKVVKESKAVDEKELTPVICQSIGNFLTQVEAALSARDASDAQARVKKALADVNAVLQKYVGIHRVEKIINIAEGLAWDTYTAVELRQSVQGNTEFIEAIRAHKQKYIDTCVNK